MGKILVIDSGVGGISTLCCIKAVLPCEEYIYFADKRFMPYGDKSENVIKERVVAICKHFFSKEKIKAVVVACNTATACGIEYLRKLNKHIIFIGVEPAIKPAIKELKQGNILVLVTPNTARQQRFLDLIKLCGQQSAADTMRDFMLKSDCRPQIIITPMPRLAPLIEDNILSLHKITQKIHQMLAPYKRRNIESIVLGCTHYCFIKNTVAEFLSAKIYDGNIGAAMRLYDLLKSQNLINRKGYCTIEFIKTLD